jgi:epoxyqueuosine reductase
MCSQGSAWCPFHVTLAAHPERLWQDERVTHDQRAGTWAQHQAEVEAIRRSPEHLAALADDVVAFGRSLGFAAIGLTSVDPLIEARNAIHNRVECGFHADMSFTFADPERSTSPARLLPDAATLIVVAWGYHRHEVASPVDDLLDAGRVSDARRGRIAQYQWRDHYGELKNRLDQISLRLRDDGWRTRVVADDNGLVDRAAAHRAGLGWFGKNANLLLPELGSWFVLGSIVTDAALPTNDQPVADGCGSCTRCLPACPTGAIVSPGVIDANRCLAWVVQASGDIDESLRVAMHDRIYGCDDCQDACPENRRADRIEPPPLADPTIDRPWAELIDILEMTDGELLDSFGRWYLADRNPDLLRRNAAVALGNVGDPASVEVEQALNNAVDTGSPILVRHATWALERLSARTCERAE